MHLGPESCKVSFIIPVLNGEKFLLGCLQHIKSEMKNTDEIIIVDNGSSDNTVAIATDFGGIKLIESHGTTVSASRNKGASLASGDLLAFIDCDCRICPGWRDAAINILKENDSVVATGSHYDLPEKSTWVERAWLYPRKKRPSEAEYIVSGNLIVKKSAFESIGGFDEELATDEDTDIGRRLREKGFIIIQAPQVRSVHLGNAKTLGQFLRKEYWHATGITQKIGWKYVDRPLLMTFAFILFMLTAAILVPPVVTGKISPWYLVGSIFVVPVVTALYRIYRYDSARQFVPQLFLYFVFYCIRSVIFIRYLIMGGFGKLQKGDN